MLEKNILDHYYFSMVPDVITPEKYDSAVKKMLSGIFLFKIEKTRFSMFFFTFSTTFSTNICISRSVLWVNHVHCLFTPVKAHLGNAHLGNVHLGNSIWATCHLGNVHLGNVHLGKLHVHLGNVSFGQSAFGQNSGSFGQKCKSSLHDKKYCSVFVINIVHTTHHYGCSERFVVTMFFHSIILDLTLQLI